VLREHGGKGFGTFKEILADSLIAHLDPIRTEMLRYLEDLPSLDAELRKGAEKAEAIAQPIVTEVKRIVGFLPRV
jgi:tryptophanyl-tRNA synthetase